MIASSTMTGSRKTRRTSRPGNDSPKLPKAKDDRYTKLGVYLSKQAYERLAIHSVRSGEDYSTAVDRIINESLRQYVVSVRGNSADQVTGNASTDAV